MEGSLTTCKSKAQDFCRTSLPYEQSIEKYSTLKNDFQFIQTSLGESIKSLEQFQGGLTDKVKEKAQLLVKNMKTQISSIDTEILKLKQHQSDCSKKH